MNVLLVNPTSGPIGDYGALAKGTSELPQIGLSIIATVLKKQGHNVKIVDLHIEALGIDELISILREGKYSVVGFSVYITTVENTLIFAKAIKNAIPDILICVGGPQVTLNPIFFNKPYIDYLFIGEADFTFPSLVSALGNKISPGTICGCLKNEAGKLTGSRKLNLVEDMDSVPFVEMDSFYDLRKFYQPAQIRGRRAINALSVRGCPYSCTFCAAATITGRKLRKVSVGRFVDHIETMVNKGYDSIMIYDDTFTIDRQRAIEISREIIRRKLKIVWNCWSRADCVDSETLDIMRQAGCYLINFGFESFNDKTLRLLKKGFTQEQCLRAIEITKNAGILTQASFMFGLPGESRDDIMNTINMVLKTRLDIGIFGVFELYEGTPIYEDCKVAGRWVRLQDAGRSSYAEEVWVPHGFERSHIEGLVRHAFNRFYLRPYYAGVLLKMLLHLNWERRARLVMTGLDYFIFQKFFSTAKKFIKGSRYR